MRGAVRDVATMTGQGAGLAALWVAGFSLETVEGETVVSWYGDVNVAGRLAAFGPRASWTR